MVDVISGIGNIRREYEALSAATCQEICNFDQPPYLANSDLSAPEGIEDHLIGKGVRYRIVYDRQALEAHGLDELKRSARQGIQMRVAAGCRRS